MCCHSYQNNTSRWAVHHWKPEVFSIPVRCMELRYGVYLHNYRHLNYEYSNNYLLCTILQLQSHQQNAEDLSFPMMYHTIVYTVYSPCIRTTHTHIYMCDVCVCVHVIFPPLLFQYFRMLNMSEYTPSYKIVHIHVHAVTNPPFCKSQIQSRMNTMNKHLAVSHQLTSDRV